MANIVQQFPQVALAEFSNPPVVETVLSAQFERLSAMRTVHLGMFWRTLKDRYPVTQERMALPPVVERFPEPGGASGRVRFEATDVPDLPRLWFLNEPGTEMIQVQGDRFVKNWRKQGTADSYPRYEASIKPAFQRDFQDFKDFLATEGLGDIAVNQCEVTYVNHIVSGDGWHNFADAGQLFTCFSAFPPQTPGRLEDLTAHLRFPITDSLDNPIGRLHVDIQPALRMSDDRPMYVMNLTARGHVGVGIGFFDIGRQWIVRSFEALTTPRMHSIWGKK